MESLSAFWIGLGRAARTGLIIGTLLVIASMIALGVWAYRPEYQILFADVASRDAAAMTAELEKMKVPYELAENGTAILVPREMVYKTRLALMGKDVPLHGAVGFEVFNNADFGMTEFVQKVNYLRAIQGELTRTILAIDGVQNARVHLALPETVLFKKSATKPKASVTLTMKSGQSMSTAQVAGIQRLVAASVNDIVSDDVTVLDQHGVALTRLQSEEESANSGTAQLDAKRSTEEYMVRKVAAVLDRTFGAGEAIATVDIALNLDRGKLTTEEVIPAKMPAGEGVPSGVVVRERQSMRDEPKSAGGASKDSAASITTSESDYQVGRRIEQMAIAGGTVRRMTVSVVVRQSLSDVQIAKLKEVVGLALGFNVQRGDAIVVNSMDRLVTPSSSVAPEMSRANAIAGAVPLVAPATPDRESVKVVAWVLAALIAIVVLAGLFYAVLRRRRQPPVLLLDATAREKMLLDVRRWIAFQPTEGLMAEARK